MDSELLQLLQECELPDQVIGWMRDVWGITCFRHLAHWCSHISEVEEVIFSELPMPSNHLVLANLRAAWTAASHKY